MSKSKETKTFNIDDIVLCKLRGFPSWPGKIVAPIDVTDEIKAEKPPKGIFHLIRFFPKGDHCWAPPRDLTMLTPVAIESYLSEPSKKNGELLTAYKIAKDPSTWETEFFAKLAEKKRKWEAKMENVDMLDEDDEGEDEREEEETDKKGAKKRKRENETAENGKTKKPKKEKEPKKEAEKKAKSVKSSTKPIKPEASSSKAGVEEEALPSDPNSIKVKEWRHKLQRAFLSKTQPNEKDMPQIDQYFATVEAYNEMTIEQLQYSKIGKVMRKVAALAVIPRDDEFKFRERATNLMNKWQTQLNAAGTSEDGPVKPESGAAPASLQADSVLPGPTEEVAEDVKVEAEPTKAEVTEEAPKAEESFKSVPPSTESITKAVPVSEEKTVLEGEGEKEIVAAMEA